jgi:hypothetical protein
MEGNFRATIRLDQCPEQIVIFSLVVLRISLIDTASVTIASEVPIVSALRSHFSEVARSGESCISDQRGDQVFNFADLCWPLLSSLTPPADRIRIAR